MQKSRSIEFTMLRDLAEGCKSNSLACRHSERVYPTGLLAGGALVPGERFAADGPSAQGQFICPRHFIKLAVSIKITTPNGVVIFMEQVKGIEPSCSAWEADVLPLNYTCTLNQRA